MKIEIRCSHLVQNNMYACQNLTIAELNMGQKTFVRCVPLCNEAKKKALENFQEQSWKGSLTLKIGQQQQPPVGL